MENTIKYEKITGKKAEIFCQELGKIGNSGIDWLLASWEKGLSKEEKALARKKYQDLEKLRIRLLTRWKKHL